MKTNNNISYKEILDQAIHLESTLLQLEVEPLPVNDKVKSYLRFDLKKMRFVTECNAYILFHIAKDFSDQPRNQCCIIDHGAGLGLFAFLVKSLGFISVYHDLSEEYASGAKILGQALGCCPDHFIVGDTKELIDYCHNQNLKISGLGSRNVIEHIPDYRVFFADLKKLVSGPVSFVFATSANIHNPIVKKIHRRIHKNYELIGPKLDMDNEKTDNTKSGYNMRIQWIRDLYPNLKEDELTKLATLGRGYIETDYKKLCDEYIKTGQFPPSVDNTTNTRDFFSGIWVERLVPLSDYKNAAKQVGFDCSGLPGFYNTHYSKTYLNLFAHVLNIFIDYFPFGKISMSPFLCFKLTNKM